VLNSAEQVPKSRALDMLVPIPATPQTTQELGGKRSCVLKSSKLTPSSVVVPVNCTDPSAPDANVYAAFRAEVVAKALVEVANVQVVTVEVAVVICKLV